MPVFTNKTQRAVDSTEHPGKALRHMIEAKSLSKEDLANILGCSRQTVSNIVAGKSGITADMAIGLAAVFGNQPSDWLKWDAEYQLSIVSGDKEAVARRARLYEVAPVREMQKRGWIRDTNNLTELEAELEGFFGGPIDHGVVFPVATSRTVTLSGLNPAERAWCFKARELAHAALPVAEFSAARMEQAEKKLRQLAAYPKEIKKLPMMLAYYGIRFAVVEPLAGARVDGAAFWIDETPAITVSVRWDRIDAFWFTVMHEFEHIKNEDAFSIDSNLLQEGENGVVVVLASNDAERRANEQAASVLVPQDELQSFISRLSPLYSTERIVQFANRIKMHPGIIIGQLQHRGELGYNAHRSFLVKVRSLITETALTDGWGQSMTPRLI